MILALSTAHARPVTQAGLLLAGSEDHAFWGAVADFAKAAAADLNIDLVVKHSRENSYSIKKNGLKLIDTLGDSGYLLSGYYRAVTPDLLEAAEEAGIKTIIFNSDVLENDRATVGEPRGTYTNWIAHMKPDERRAGHELGAILVERALKRTGDDGAGTLSVLAITGPLSRQSMKDRVIPLRSILLPDEQGREQLLEDSTVSLQRLSGLEEYTRSEPAADMLGYLDAYWLPEQAHDLTRKALAKFDIDIVWSASDTMALAAARAARETDQTSAGDIVFGGFDWTDSGLKAVADGTMAATMGGHFMEAGWALVLIHDHARGNDFVDATGVKMITEMSAITADNVDHYLKHFGDRQWDKVDFKVFSRFHNENLNDYDFSLDALLEQMN